MDLWTTDANSSTVISNVKSVSNADIDFMYLGTDWQKCIVKYKYG